MAKTKPNTSAFIYSQIYTLLLYWFSLIVTSLFSQNTKQYYRTYISLLGLPLQRVLPDCRNITYRRGSRNQKGVSMFLKLSLSWGSGGAVSPPVGPGQSLGGGPEGKGPGSSPDFSTLKIP